jgi:hypothetical protein
MSVALDPSRILEVGFSFWGSKVLLTAVELEVFTKLGHQSMTALFTPLPFPAIVGAKA